MLKYFKDLVPVECFLCEYSTYNKNGRNLDVVQIRTFSFAHRLMEWFKNAYLFLLFLPIYSIGLQLNPESMLLPILIQPFRQLHAP